jgi:hypothetical protein
MACVLGVLLPVLHSTDRTVCRLHVDQSRLSSLRGPIFEDSSLSDFKISPDDRALALSPCLHSVGLRWEHPGPGNYIDYNLEAVQQMLHRWNPNLRTVDIYRCNGRRKGTPYWNRIFVQQADPLLASSRPYRLWRGFGSKTPSGGTLTSLRVGDRYGSIGTNSFKQFAMDDGFAGLRTLRICRCISLDAIRWMVECNRSRATLFPSLTCFVLAVPWNLWERPPRGYASVTRSLLRYLPPLKGLTLSGCLDGSMRDTEALLGTMLEFHRDSLVRLSLPDSCLRPTARLFGGVDRITSKCSPLRYLSGNVARSHGD